jgi:hypothetical protein
MAPGRPKSTTPTTPMNSFAVIPTRRENNREPP